MLDKYVDNQNVVYNLLMNEVKTNHVSHAYLFDENNCSDSFDIVISFAKEILCSKLDVNEKTILCQKIDDGNYSELKVIEPDGMIIKKQQILDLQKDFSRRAVEGNKRVYIIRDADKMRSETANSMLKFLEEPDNDLVAILMTNNFNNLLPTIISRCQVIKLKNNGSDDCNRELDLTVLNFIKSIEDIGIKTILYEQELLFNIINNKEREKFIIFFDKIIDMYYDILKILNGGKNIKFNNYFDDLKKISVINDQEEILRKINNLLKMKDRIKNNVNINLLIDNLIVDIGGIYEGSWY